MSAASVANFPGLHYGKIPSRFRRSQLVHAEALRPDVFDATTYGHSCPQPSTFKLGKKYRAHLYEGARPSTEAGESEFDCLRLNIYTPAQSLSANSAKVPVLVSIHSGGFVSGDGS
ncbi:hypothetical protein ACO1O0_003563 [Amphichorda felina]